MNKKEVFLNFVFLGAIARDICLGTRDSQLIALKADQIPEDRIPRNALNAAKVFLAYVDGRTPPHRWMRHASPWPGGRSQREGVCG